MAGYEYKVVPAPSKGQRAKGVKGAENRFAFALEQTMNEMAREGWEFQRSETLPSEERTGLTTTTTNWRNVLVFRRPVIAEQDLPKEDPMLLVSPVQPKALEDLPPEKPAAKPARPSPVFDLGEDDMTELDSLGQVVRNRAAELRDHADEIEDAEELGNAQDDGHASDEIRLRKPASSGIAAQ